MPKKLEEELEREYASMPKERREHAVYGTLNKLGYMKGSKETKKGRALDKMKKK